MITSTLERTNPHRPMHWRRVVVVALGAVLAAVACGIVGVAFVQGSWWYSYGTDRPLDHASRARVEAIRDDVDVSGIAPEAVVWLDAALDPDVDPTAVRAYLLAAQEALVAADGPGLAQSTSELRMVIETTWPPRISATITPLAVPTLEWPW